MMGNHFLYLCIFFLFITNIQSARILAVFPTPSISHQVVFRPLTQELLKRGHELVIITTDPVFPGGQAPENLTEIDVHDISYSIWNKMLVPEDGKQMDWLEQMEVILVAISSIFIEQAKTKDVQMLLSKDKSYFDLLLLEACVRPALAYSYAFTAPVIQVSSLAAPMDNYDIVGASTHPLLFPSLIRDRLYNLTMWEKIQQIKKELKYKLLLKNMQTIENEALVTIFGNDIPPLVKLYNNVDMLFLNVHQIWDNNRLVPPNVIYLGGLHQQSRKQLPKDLQSYLDSATNGIIYFSLGSNVKPSMIPPEKFQVILNVFSRLPYNIIMKWDSDIEEGCASNIKLSKWLPQSELLRHPNVKLFVTQGGLQSTDEAITAGVPMIGLPIFGDQFYNVDKYAFHGIGIPLDVLSLTEEDFENAIKTIISDISYTQNIVKLRDVMHDQPQTPLDRAVWWTEYVIRHGGARHIRPPSANITWSEYLELKLVFTIVIISSLLFILFYKIAKCFLIKYPLDIEYVKKIKKCHID